MDSILIITSSVLALTSVALAIRLSGMKSDRDDADTKRRGMEQQLQSTMREFTEYRRAKATQLRAMREDLTRLRAKNLATATATEVADALDDLFKHTEERKQ